MIYEYRTDSNYSMRGQLRIMKLNEEKKYINLNSNEILKQFMKYDYGFPCHTFPLDIERIVRIIKMYIKYGNSIHLLLLKSFPPYGNLNLQNKTQDIYFDTDTMEYIYRKPYEERVKEFFDSINSNLKN